LQACSLSVLVPLKKKKKKRKIAFIIASLSRHKVDHSFIHHHLEESVAFNTLIDRHLRKWPIHTQEPTQRPPLLRSSYIVFSVLRQEPVSSLFSRKSSLPSSRKMTHLKLFQKCPLAIQRPSSRARSGTCNETPQTNRLRTQNSQKGATSWLKCGRSSPHWGHGDEKELINVGCGTPVVSAAAGPARRWQLHCCAKTASSLFRRAATASPSDAQRALSA
jgi:hypothetical protein